MIIYSLWVSTHLKDISPIGSSFQVVEIKEIFELPPPTWKAKESPIFKARVAGFRGKVA